MKKTFIKGVAALTTVGILTTAVVPAVGAETISNPSKFSHTSLSPKVKLSAFYRELDSTKKAEFEYIVEGLNLSESEQLQLLKDRSVEQSTVTPRWKTAIIKKAAALIAAKVGSKTVADITNFLFSWEDDLQMGIEKALIKYGHFNKTVAHWTAKSIMFILF